MYASGELSTKDIAVGKNIPLGNISWQLAQLDSPVKLTLTVNTVTANSDYNYPIENSWDFWVYPSVVEMPQCKDIYITDTLDRTALGTLEKGGKVLLMAAGKITLGSDVKQTYMPVF